MPLTLPPDTVIRGNPPSSTHQIDPVELVTLLDEIYADSGEALDVMSAIIGGAWRSFGATEPLGTYKVQIGSDWYAPEALVIGATGQSGMGENSGQTGGDTTTDPNVFAWNRITGQIVPAQLGAEPFQTSGLVASVSFAMAKRLSAIARAPVVIVNEPVGGSGIATHLPGGANFTTFDTAMSNALAAAVGTLTVDKAVADFIAMNHGEDWSAIGPLWTISEQRFAELIEGWRARPWCDARTRLIFGEVMREADGATAYRANREWARLVARRKFTNVHLVSTAGLTVQGDGIHATGPSIDELGKRYAEVAAGLATGIVSDALHLAALDEDATVIDEELFDLAAELTFDPTDVTSEDVTVTSLAEGARVVWELDGVRTKVVTDVTKAVTLTVSEAAQSRLKIWLPAYSGADQPYKLSAVAAGVNGAMVGARFGRRAQLSQIYVAGHPGLAGYVDPREWPRTLETFRLQTAPKADFTHFVAEAIPPSLTLLNLNACLVPKHVQDDITAVNTARGNPITVSSLGTLRGAVRVASYASVTELTNAMGAGMAPEVGMIAHILRNDWTYDLVYDGTATAISGVAPTGWRLRTTNFPTRALAVSCIAAGWTMDDGMTFRAADRLYRFNSATATAPSDMAGVEPAGEPTPEHYKDNDTPGTTTMGAAVASAAAHSAAAGIRLRAWGRYNVNGTAIELTEDADLTGAVFIDTNAGQTVPVLTVKAKAADISIADSGLLTAANAAGPFHEGQTSIPGLAAYAGQSLRLADSGDYIARSGGSAYRHEFAFTVLDSTGAIWPPFPYAYSGTLTTADKTVVRNPVRLTGGRFEITGGSTKRTGGIVSFTAPGARWTDGEIENLTATDIAILCDVNGTGVHLERIRLSGAGKTGSDGYGVKVAGAGHWFVDLHVANCRRSWDGTYSAYNRIRGGSYLNAIGGHLDFGTEIEVADVYSDTPNKTCLIFSGGNHVARGCRLTSRGTGSKAIASRSDTPEHFGAMELHDCEVIFDLTGETGSPNVMLIDLQFPSTSFDPGRDIALPRSMRAPGTTVRIVNDGGVTPVFYLARVDPQHSNIGGGRAINVGGVVDFATTKVTQASGTIDPRLLWTKLAAWAGGDILVQLPALSKLRGDFVGATAGAAGTTARTRLRGTGLGDVTLTVGGGVVAEYDLDCRSLALTVNGTTAKQNDEQWWHRVLGSPPMYQIGSLADDAVFRFRDPVSYGIFMLMERNGGAAARLVEFLTDQSGLNAPTGLRAVGLTVGYYDAALAGTTQTDGQLNIANAGGDVWIENRTGAPIALTLIRSGGQ